MNKKDEDVLVIKENRVVSFCKDHKKIVIILLVLLVLVLVGLICLFNIDNFKYCSSDKVVKRYSNSYVKLDEKDYCDTLYEGIVNNVMGSKDECYRLAKKTFTDDNMKKYESIKITKREELVAYATSFVAGDTFPSPALMLMFSGALVMVSSPPPASIVTFLDLL